MRLTVLLCIVGLGTAMSSEGYQLLDRDPNRPAARPPEVSVPDHTTIPDHAVARSNIRHGPRASTSALPRAPSAAPTVPPSPAPTPMDLQLSYALSTTCLSHLSGLLSSPTFLSCLPFSLLLTTSTSFASLVASDDYALLNDLLAYVSSPQPSSATCDDFMRDAYTKTGDKGACGGDLTQTQNQSKKAAGGAAVEARTGLGNYALMRVAASLKDPDEGVYCYLQAVESERPDDLYLWSLAAGIALPKSSSPTCSKCSSLLLNHFASTSINTSPSLNSTLVNAAIGSVNSACGPSFVQYSVAPPTSGAALTVASASWGLLAMLGAGAAGTVLGGLMVA